MIERVLVVGMGSIGRLHARMARSLLPSSRVVAWRHRAGAETPAEVDAVVTSVDDALAFRPQVAVIASPAPAHLEAARVLAAAGVHLLIEKPIAASSDGVSRLLARCREANVVVLTGYNLRFLPALREFRELVQSGIVGQILSVRAEVGQHLMSWRPGTDYRQNVSAQSALGGGVLLELSHEIDYLRWVFGEIEWVSAIARRQSAMEIDVEDTAHLMLEFAAEGAMHPVIGSLSLDFVRHDSTRNCVAIGEHGSLRWVASAGSVEVFGDSAPDWQAKFRHASARDDSYRAEWEHFLACVNGEARPLISGEDGLATLLVVEAARESSATRRAVRVGGASEEVE